MSKGRVPDAVTREFEGWLGEYAEVWEEELRRELARESDLADEGEEGW